MADSKEELRLSSQYSIDQIAMVIGTIMLVEVATGRQAGNNR